MGSYEEKQRRIKERDERNEERTHQFLIDRYNEGYQEVEVGREVPRCVNIGGAPVYAFRGEPYKYGIDRIVTCFHPNKDIKSFAIPIDLYMFLCYLVDEGVNQEFETLEDYEAHKEKWQIEITPRENLENYLYRNNLLVESADFVI